jgi:hypothetical protein
LTLDEVVTAAGPDSDPGAIGGPDPQTCDQFRPSRAPAGMLVMIEEGRLTRISLVDASPVKTDRGLGVGDGKQKVLSAYGKAARVTPHEYVGPPGAYVTIWQTGAGPEEYVQNPAARGLVYEIGENGLVEAIHAGGPSIQYVEGCA